MKDKNKIIKKILNSLNANDIDYARRLIENDLKRLGVKDEYYFYLALITKDLEIKKELYTNAIEVNPNFADAYINRGLVENELKEYDNSIADYDKAIELDGKCALAFNNRGYSKYLKGDFDGALQDYNKAILLNPKMKMALDNKAMLFSKACMEDDKDFGEKYYLSLGIAELRDGNISEAIKSFDESITLNPHQELPYFYKAIAYQSLGKNDEAYEYYTKTLEINKNMVDAYYNRGQLIYKTNPKQAIDDFVAAIALDSKFIEAYYSLAAVQKNIGQYEDAIKNLDKIIELEPQAVNAKGLKKLILTKYLKR